MLFLMASTDLLHICKKKNYLNFCSKMTVVFQTLIKILNKKGFNIFNTVSDSRRRDLSIYLGR